MNFIISLFFVSQSYNQEIADIIQRVSLDSIYDVIYKLQKFWTRHYLSDSMYKSRLWIKSKLENYGYFMREHIFFYGGREQANIIATKYGILDTLNPIIITAHYDSRGLNWWQPPYGPAPGADDNASGVSLLIEVARIIKDMNFNYTIKFVAFAAEEPGLIGSQKLADYYIQNNRRIKYLFNVDMIGGDINYLNNRVIVEWDMGNQVDSNDNKSFAYAETLATMYNLYTTLNTVYGNIFASDYLPFEAYGYTTLGLFEYYFNSGYHSEDDIVDSLDINYATTIIKGALAFILHTAKLQPSYVKEKITSKNITFIKNNIYDISGRKVNKDKILKGIYILKDGSITKKIIKIK
ncbi:MAG: M20/M25/M40 family metallo-hydrolase [Candidatus Hydrothermales bacterium]